MISTAWEKTVTETLMVLSELRSATDWPRDTLFMVRFAILFCIQALTEYSHYSTYKKWRVSKKT